MDSPRKQQAKGTWRMLKGKLRETWGTLTSNEIQQYKGKKDQLVGYLTNKTGKTRASVRRKVDKLADDVKYRF